MNWKEVKKICTFFNTLFVAILCIIIHRKDTFIVFLSSLILQKISWIQFTSIHQTFCFFIKSFN